MNTALAIQTPLRNHILYLRKKYAHPSRWRSTWQLVNTLVPHFALNAVIYISWNGPVWITAALLFLNSLFLNRIFVLFHDLMHLSLYKSRRVNETLGTLMGFLVFMPAHHWQYEHNFHHATSNDLGRRGYGDMPVLTVREYRALRPWRRFCYRVLRHPAFLFTFHAFYKLVIFPRFVANRAWPRQAHVSVHVTNIMIVAVGLGLWTVGLERLFWIQALSFAISTPSMVFLFYINHHFEQVRWEQPKNWTFMDAALKGTSIFLYPPVMKWFSAGIGLHCMHHLVPRIPNYYLERCWKENQLFERAAVIPFAEGLAAMKLRLWDEDAGRYVCKEGYRL